MKTFISHLAKDFRDEDFSRLEIVTYGIIVPIVFTLTLIML